MRTMAVLVWDVTSSATTPDWRDAKAYRGRTRRLRLPGGAAKVAKLDRPVVS